MDIFHKQEQKAAQRIIKNIEEKESEFWIKEGRKKSLALFKNMAKRVPAYKDFLRKNKINPDKINTWKDFQLAPPTDKKNYLRQYSFEKLFWDGSLKKPMVFTATSGSTGEPFYFARNERIDWQSSIIHELFLKQTPAKENGPILVIVCFGMGVWIGGLITYEAFEMASRRENYPLSILTPGINKKEIFKALKKIAPNFKQVIMVGYPPFLKDIIDEAPGEGIDLNSLNIRFVFAAEVFTEKFRDYIAQKSGLKNLYSDIIHIYGSADIGTMAWETGAATLIKRMALKNQNIFNILFSSIAKVPTLAQFNPSFINFEALDGELLLTGDSAIPLIRYAIGDRGGVFSFNDAVSVINKNGYNFQNEAKKAGIDNFINKLPFVYVYERTDLSTTIYGLQIFPEMIRDVLFEKDIQDYLTGKFTLETKFNYKQDQYLEINLELKKDKIAGDEFKKILTDKIVSALQTKSSEFNELYSHLKERAIPKLIFWPFGHQQYFKQGIKQKWVKN